MDTQYKRTLAGSVGAGMGALFNASGRTYYILEHKTESKYHPVGESQKIIVDQVELGRDSSCQVRFDDSCETVSRKHAAIVRDGENWKLIPLSQTNATFVNGQRVENEYRLNSGDEIQLSSRGPVMGFIVPQGAKSLVKSIGMTERMNLFRKQALRPYKTGLTILSIALVLAIGGLLTYNILQDKKHSAQMADATERIEAANAEISGLNEQAAEANAKIDVLEQEKDAANAALQELSAKAENAESERVSAQAQLDSLKNITNTTKEELAQATERARKAENAAYAARQAAKSAASTADAAQEKLAAIENQKEEITAKIAAAEAVKKEAEAQIGETVEVKVENLPFAEVNACNNAVYYIKMNEIVIYSDNQEVVRFNTENKIGGTGFLLSDGRFVTAHRVIEPWFYQQYANGEIGKDRKGNKWTYKDVQYCAIHGLKVVANCTAYSPSGSNFQFRNSDLTTHPLVNKNDNDLVVLGVELEDYTPRYFLRSVVKASVVKKLRWYTSTIHRHDWASMAKNDQLNTVKGLLFSNSVSLNPQSGTEVRILGYPKLEGFSNSQSVTPNKMSNTVNVSGLNDKKTIELSSRRYQEGNDGAPVLQIVDGQWTVIGVLSHTDSADRDVVIPIANTRK